MPLTEPVVILAGPGIIVTDSGSNDFEVSASLIAGPNITINQVGNAYAITGAAGGGGGSAQWVESSPAPRLSTTASVAFGSDTAAQTKGVDTTFWVSGSTTTGSATDGISAFAGTVVVSGNLKIGSLQGSSTNNFIQLWSTGDVSASDSGSLRLYTRSRAGRLTVEQIGPFGIDTPLQPGLFSNSVFMYSPGVLTTTGSLIGWTFNVSGTISHPILTGSGMQLGTISRTRFATNAVLGHGAGMYGARTVCFRGAHAGQGGFFFFARFGASTFNNASKFFVGLAVSASALVTVLTDISTSFDFIGVGWDRTDPSTGSWRIMSRDQSTFQKITVSNVRTRNVTTGSIFDLTMFCPTRPASTGSFVGIRFVEHVSASNGITKNVLVDNLILSTSLPRDGFPLRVHAGINNALSASVNEIQINRLYLETDY